MRRGVGGHREGRLSKPRVSHILLGSLVFALKCSYQVKIDFLTFPFIFDTLMLVTFLSYFAIEKRMKVNIASTKGDILNLILFFFGSGFHLGRG